GGIAADHADEIFERWGALWGIRRRKCWRSLGGSLGSGRRRVKDGLPAGFALLFLHALFAQLPFWGEGAAIDYAEGFFVLFVFVVFFAGQGEFPQYCVSRNFSIWRLFLGSGGPMTVRKEIKHLAGMGRSGAARLLVRACQRFV